MTLDRAVQAFAGIMVIASVLLTKFVHPNFVWLTAFVGFNLFQSSLTGFCPLDSVLKKLGVREDCQSC